MKIDIAKDLAARATAHAEMLTHHALHASIYQGVAQALEDLPIISATCCYRDITLSMSGSKADLRAAFHALRTLGFNIPSYARPTAEDRTQWSGYFEHPEGARVYISFASTVCKMVKTGTRSTEVPVYELQCGDPADASLADLSPDPLIVAPEPPAAEEAAA